MDIAIGLDIGGTKIAGASFDQNGQKIAQTIMPTPLTYDSFLNTCQAVVADIEQKSGVVNSVGVSIRGVLNRETGVMERDVNLPYLSGVSLQTNLAHVTGREIHIENDANCAALAEAVQGAGMGHRSVFGLIIGTGIGGGFVFDGKIINGANGLCGEIGHLPLPYYEESDGQRVLCGCGQMGCIEKLIAGPALAKLYERMTGQSLNTSKIAILADEGDADAYRVLDHYYTTVAKAMVTILHSFDPEIIVVSGGMNALPGFYKEVPKRWEKYTVKKNLVTEFVPSAFGPMAGLRGAACLGAKN